MGTELTGIRVRPATLADLDALLEIEQSCFTSDLLSRRQMRYMLAQARAFSLLAVSSSSVLAYCSCLTPAQPKPARLYSLAVRPQFRGRGIAAGLLDKALENCRKLGYTRCRLEVRKLDANTQRLYQKFGFSLLQELPGYYEDGADGIRMEATLRKQKS